MGVQELLVVLAILLLFFGAKKLPGLAGSLGTSIKEFRSAVRQDPDADPSDATASGGEDPTDADDGR